MTPILFSLIALTVTFAALVIWAYSNKTRDRWEQASQLPFDEALDRAEPKPGFAANRGAVHDD